MSLLKLIGKQIAAAAVETIRFAVDLFTEAEAVEWLEQQGWSGLELEEIGDQLVARQRDKDVFDPGSIRLMDAIESGVSATIGLPLVTKSGLGVVDAQELHILEDLEIFEVTLTSTPAIGQPGHFRVIKALGRKPEIVKHCEILKVDDDQRVVAGYCMVPHIDLEGDITTPETIEAAARSFMRNGFVTRSTKGHGAGLEHEMFDGIGHPIGSIFDADGKFGIAGGWWLEMQVEDDEVWAAIKRGDIRGFSIGGLGIRRPAEPGELELKSVVLLRATDFDPADAQAFCKEYGYRTATRAGDWWVVDAPADFDLSAGWEIESLGGAGAVSVAKRRSSFVRETLAADKELDGMDLASELIPKVIAAVEAAEGDLVWVEAMFVDRVVFSLWSGEPGEMFAWSFSVNSDNQVVLDERVKVRQDFIEVEQSKGCICLDMTQGRGAGRADATRTFTTALQRHWARFAHHEDISMTAEELKAALDERDTKLRKSIVDAVVEKLSMTVATERDSDMNGRRAPSRETDDRTTSVLDTIRQADPLRERRRSRRQRKELTEEADPLSERRRSRRQRKELTEEQQELLAEIEDMDEDEFDAMCEGLDEEQLDELNDAIELAEEIEADGADEAAPAGDAETKAVLGQVVAALEGLGDRLDDLEERFEKRRGRRKSRSRSIDGGLGPVHLFNGLGLQQDRRR